MKSKQKSAVISIYSSKSVFDEQEIYQKFPSLDLEHEHLHRLKNRLAHTLYVIDNNPLAVFLTDLNGVVKWVNTSAEKISGYTCQELIDQNMRVLKSHHQSKEFYRIMWEDLTNKGYWEGQLWNRKKDGSLYYHWTRLFALRDEHGETTEYASISLDISDHRLTLKRLEESIHIDSLTGLPNRNRLKHDINEIINQYRKIDSHYYLVMFDIDNFADVNLLYGFRIGDRILVEIVHRLQEVIRPQDNLYRFGSNNFALLIRDITDTDTILATLNNIQQCIRRTLQVDGHEIKITASMGISSYPDDHVTYDNLFKGSELALREAKNSGKDVLKFFSNDINKKASLWLQIGNHLDTAIENNELNIYYQIQVNNKDQNIIGAETLIRWHHPELGIVTPNQFIPYAESSGTIIPLGYWIIEQVFKDINEFKKQNIPNIQYSINLSAKQLTDPMLIRTVTHLVEMYRIDTSRVIFEITESSAITNPETTLIVFKQLKELGFGLALDDFGKGFSSLSFLSQFPIDILKIDRSFITNAYQNEKKKQLAAAILSMIHTIGLKVVAEGIESMEDVAFLMDQPCDLLQGFHFSKPLPKHHFKKLIQSKKDTGYSFNKKN